ncbi:MAG: DUF2061 domain-containing protein [Verrucomicrobia bacterium]|nr:DUF2061 domain-containing protein [Verrucomicrobiota bacterium]
MADKHYRSLAKAISYRITGTVSTMLISLLVTGKVEMALSIGLLELLTKTSLYYAHERIWNSLSFGRVKGREDYEI